jgi:hypothetical protein
VSLVSPGRLNLTSFMVSQAMVPVQKEEPTGVVVWGPKEPVSDDSVFYEELRKKVVATMGLPSGMLGLY